MHTYREMGVFRFFIISIVIYAMFQLFDIIVYKLSIKENNTATGKHVVYTQIKYPTDVYLHKHCGLVTRKTYPIIKINNLDCITKLFNSPK